MMIDVQCVPCAFIHFLLDTNEFFASFVGYLSIALAFIFSGFHAGTIGAYLLSPYIMDVWSINSQNDWRLLFYAYGTLGVLILIPWLTFAKDEPTTNKSGASATTTRTSWDEALQSYRNAPWKGFIGSKGVWGMLLAHSAKNWGLYTSLSWTPTFYAEQYDIGVRDSAWLSVMPSVAGALGGFVAGSLADTTLNQMSGSMINDVTTTRIRKVFQTVGLLGPAIALAALAYQLPEEAWLAQLYLMVAVGLQSFNAGGFEAGTQDKAGPRWIGMLYSVTSLPSVMGTSFCTFTIPFLSAVLRQSSYSLLCRFCFYGSGYIWRLRYRCCFRFVTSRLEYCMVHECCCECSWRVGVHWII